MRVIKMTQYLRKQKRQETAHTISLKIMYSPEAVTQRYSVKKVLLEISQYSQQNTCARVSFLIKLQACVLQLY